MSENIWLYDARKGEPSEEPSEPDRVWYYLRPSRPPRADLDHTELCEGPPWMCHLLEVSHDGGVRGFGNLEPTMSEDKPLAGPSAHMHAWLDLKLVVAKLTQGVAP